MTDVMMIEKVCTSDSFRAERAALGRGGCCVADRPALVKQLDNRKVRLIFRTDARVIDYGVTVGLVCLFDQIDEANIYAHPVHAGPGVNTALSSLFVPETQAQPQPGVAGYKARQKFVAWKKAAWAKFLIDELEAGTEEASAIWLTNFWKALDRMYGGGNLVRDV